MSITIAVAGKGGTGKTAISALLAALLAKESPPVLAVDGDPATNLHQALGLPLDDETNTIGGIRELMEEKITRAEFAPGTDKQAWLDARIFEGLVESVGLDLLAMGRSESQGCYCAVNHMLRYVLDKLAGNYQYVVIDNEAGMEHISRQTTRDVDVLLIISDPTARGISAAVRTRKLIDDLRTNVGQIYLVVNRLAGDISPQMGDLIAGAGLDLLVTIPEDPNMASLETEGRPLTELPPDSPLRRAVVDIAAKTGLLAGKPRT
ncbi:AAA family ATPase [Dehalococcoidia bacterium]|nr:AAA family ATPase [Dehalococcoidia bacterium]